MTMTIPTMTRTTTVMMSTIITTTVIETDAEMHLNSKKWRLRRLRCVSHFLSRLPLNPRHILRRVSLLLSPPPPPLFPLFPLLHRQIPLPLPLSLFLSLSLGLALPLLDFIPSYFQLFSPVIGLIKKTRDRRTDGPTDRWTGGRADGRSDPFMKMQSHACWIRGANSLNLLTCSLALRTNRPTDARTDRPSYRDSWQAHIHI